MRFSGRSAIITGASGSIGRAIAQAFAREGCDLGLIDIRSASDTIESAGRVQAVQADIADGPAVRAAIARLGESLGRLDILVNAAGITSTGDAATLAEAEWDRVQAINLRGVFLCCQAAIPMLRSSDCGRIINIGSILAKNGGNARPWLDPAEQRVLGNIAYGVAKAGVHAMTVFLARELAASGTTVNAVAPGPIASAMTKTFPHAMRDVIPLGRLGTPEEVASAVTFLASKEASFITGEILDVNGGAWAD